MDNKLFLHFNSNKKDTLETIADVCLTPIRYVFGYREIKEVNKGVFQTNDVQINKMKRVAAGIFSTLLFPLTAASTIIGLITLSFSKSHEKAYSIFAKTLVQPQSNYSSRETSVNPPYADAFLKDDNISDECKELFHGLFVDIINPGKIEKPLGSLVKEDGEITKFLENFSTTFDDTEKLGCRGSFHSDNKNDPWQTIKITAPNIEEVGVAPILLTEFKKSLDKHYHLRSGGGGNWKAWLKLPFEEKMNQKKYDPKCFQDTNGNIMNPQVMLTLIDIKKILGIIKTDEEYIKALEDAYNS